MPDPDEKPAKATNVIDLVSLLQASLGKKPGKAAVAEDEDDDEPPPPKRAPKPAAKDEDEEPAPRTRRVAARETEEVAASAKPKRAAAKTTAKTAAKPAAKPKAAPASQGAGTTQKGRLTDGRIPRPPPMARDGRQPVRRIHGRLEKSRQTHFRFLDVHPQQCAVDRLGPARRSLGLDFAAGRADGNERARDFQKRIVRSEITRLRPPGRWSTADHPKQQHLSAQQRR
jgi:hypothetical protein